jgi:hypothetical protein
MNNWTINKRTLFGFTIVLVMFAMVAVTSTFLLNKAKTRRQSLTEDALPGLESSESIVVTASREQTDGISQVNNAVGQMDKVTQSNAANAEERAAAGEELNSQAEVMRQSGTELVRLVGRAETQQTREIYESTNQVVHRPDDRVVDSLSGVQPVSALQKFIGC